jgi:hypothetical protein
MDLEFADKKIASANETEREVAFLTPIIYYCSSVLFLHYWTIRF